MSSPTDMPLAHVRPAPETETGWALHPLDQHLHEVAKLAADNAAPFGGADWARLAGRWHDLGKYRPPFQAKLKLRSGYDPDAHIEVEGGLHSISHSTAGALYAIRQFEKRSGENGRIAARVLAYLIASHHAGLYDWHNATQPCLGNRLNDKNGELEYQQALAALPPAEVLTDDGFDPMQALNPILGLTQLEQTDTTQPKGAFALWVRMLFSALVDADFLDTERFMNPQDFAQRSRFPEVDQLLPAFNLYMDHKTAALVQPDSTLNRLRAGILAECRSAAQQAPGAFSLTVPTGGGKTLSSLAFALEHAVLHTKRRVIYAIPYTSIIEQTADVFREVFKEVQPNPVIEHHSQSQQDGNSLASRLACENWDAPLIVTTNVQLFESLFAARTSSCRKLHNLAHSVIILDEAQQLPVGLLQPILDVLRLLIAYYGVSVVFCTATQPVLTSRQLLDTRRNLRGFAPREVRDIIADPDHLFNQLRRVQVELPPDLNTRSSWEALVNEISQEDCVLVIVNTKNDALELWNKLPEGTLYLTTQLCGAHRATLLQQIRQRLAAKRAGTDQEPLRVVSTSLVEAGVDISFPVVWRALLGLDSIAQAAGRCNREGELAGLGRLRLFVSPNGEPNTSQMQNAAATTRKLLHDYPNPQDLLADRALMAKYFARFYTDAEGHDRPGIVQALTKGVLDDHDPLAVSFRTAANNFHLIEEREDALVYVPYPADDPAVLKKLEQLDRGKPDRLLLRDLQRYVVTISVSDAKHLHTSGELEPVMPGSYRLMNAQRYHPYLGLQTSDQLIFSAKGYCF
ncbi:CRISPR-associated endonuclease Cas3'' [Parachitinimonas caeni]|uniref:CRISPR-associated endonuclease Cas3 n=1 Tax=Parachitinimonas caeni TaxID=3031301 RepID=A0ABT7E1U0_9NEIS|nr:CRISPR-associated endonuclease Cas3'' [Parachitinimonas caeni]MDK2125303.1 CRISPR-associated endonuclease Cas3'' [Parachitinimonas caeni]